MIFSKSEHFDETPFFKSGLTKYSSRFQIFIFQINGLGRFESGLMWSVHTKENIIISTFVDWSWFILSFASPMVQSLYLTCKKFKTQILIVTIRDNRKAGKSP